MSIVVALAFILSLAAALSATPTVRAPTYATTTASRLSPTLAMLSHRSARIGRLAGAAGLSTHDFRLQAHMTRSGSIIDCEKAVVAENYAPLPLVLSRGAGAWVWDVEGRRLLDLTAALSVVNQGHCHPRIVAALAEQAATLTITSRAVHSDQLAALGSYMTKLFKYDRVLLMNTGAEAFDTALKIARRWAYTGKTNPVPESDAKIVVIEGNFHGRTVAAISASSDPLSFGGYGPLLQGFIRVPFDDADAVEQALQDPTVAAFVLEPIQGEAGVRIPSAGYLNRVRMLCSKYEVLMVADEVQSGLGRAGTLLASDHDEVRPDIVMLGKALSGGMFPISAVLADNNIMLRIRPGQHGSTFGGGPLASAVALESLRVLMDEKLVDASRRLGEIFLTGLNQLRSPYVRNIRGRGLFLAFDVVPHSGKTARNLVMSLLKRGILTKETQTHTIRLAPPLVTTENEIAYALLHLQKALDEYSL